MTSPLHALVAQWRERAAEADKDGDFCCAVTRENDADELAALLLTAGPQETTDEDIKRLHQSMVNDAEIFQRFDDGNPRRSNIVLAYAARVKRLLDHRKSEPSPPDLYYQLREAVTAFAGDGIISDDAVISMATEQAHAFNSGPEHRQVHVICPQCGTPFETEGRL